MEKENKVNETKVQPKKKEKIIVVAGDPNAPMTKPQKHIIVHKRSKVYGAKVLREYIAAKYNLGDPMKVDLQKLTKLQAQDIIVNFKPHPKPEIKKEQENKEEK